MIFLLEWNDLSMHLKLLCYLYSVKCLLVNMLDLQNVETSLVGEAKLGFIHGDDRNNFCYAC